MQGPMAGCTMAYFRGHKRAIVVAARENGDQREEGNEMRLETGLGVRLCRWDLIGLGSLL